MKLEHANLTVRSLEEAVNFLQTAFPESSVRGQGSIHGDPASGRWVHFGTDDAYIAVQENMAHSPGRDVTYTNDGINHVGFVVEELDALMDRMGREGYKLSPVSVLDGHPYRRRAYFNDANGVEWEFIEYLSAVAEQRNDYQH